MHKINMLMMLVMASSSLYTMEEERMQGPTALQMLQDDIREWQGLSEEDDVGCREVTQAVVCCDCCNDGNCMGGKTRRGTDCDECCNAMVSWFFCYIGFDVADGIIKNVSNGGICAPTVACCCWLYLKRIELGRIEKRKKKDL